MHKKPERGGPFIVGENGFDDKIFFSASPKVRIAGRIKPEKLLEIVSVANQAVKSASASQDEMVIFMDEGGYYLGDPPYHLLMERAPKEKAFNEIEQTARPGFRQRKGDKPIQRGPVKRRRW